VSDWLMRRVPAVCRVDFTTVLPRAVSLTIFALVDPRSLSRAACVSWHWKFITEQVAGFIGYLGASDKRRLGGEILR